ncbi:MAG: hypothetical protein ACKO96_18195, partial [Flammeovirgaceae bacterium]
MASIFIITFSSLAHDSRVGRQIKFLKAKHQITLSAYDAPEGLVDQFIPIPKPQLNVAKKIILGITLCLRLHPISYLLLYGKNALSKNLSIRTFDLIIANDIETLPLAFTIKSLKGVILDAHEYSPRQF